MLEISYEEIFQINEREFPSKYEVQSKIAKGSFGTIHKAINLKTNTPCVIKILSKTSEQNCLRIKNEIFLHSLCNHKNIVKYHEFIETKNTIYIVMDYLQGGTLKEYMSEHRDNITEKDAKNIIQWILAAVDYLHKNEICHRDIKWDNIMFENANNLDSLKLIDFGWSTNDFSDYKYFSGTWLYSAPERVVKTGYDYKSDIWSMGIVLYKLWNKGKHPFHVKDENKDNYIDAITEMIDKNTLNIRFDIGCSFWVRNLIKKMLCVDSNERYSAGFCLQHPWFKMVNKRTEINKIIKEEIGQRVCKQGKALWFGLFVLKHINNNITDDLSSQDSNNISDWSSINNSINKKQSITSRAFLLSQSNKKKIIQLEGRSNKKALDHSGESLQTKNKSNLTNMKKSNLFIISTQPKDIRLTTTLNIFRASTLKNNTQGKQKLSLCWSPTAHNPDKIKNRNRLNELNMLFKNIAIKQDSTQRKIQPQKIYLKPPSANTSTSSTSNNINNNDDIYNTIKSKSSKVVQVDFNNNENSRTRTIWWLNSMKLNHQGKIKHSTTITCLLPKINIQ